jgi:hypothetical protein
MNSLYDRENEFSVRLDLCPVELHGGTCELDVIDSNLLRINKIINVPKVLGSAVISQPLIPILYASYQFFFRLILNTSTQPFGPKSSSFHLSISDSNFMFFL